MISLLRFELIKTVEVKKIRELAIHQTIISKMAVNLSTSLRPKNPKRMKAQMLNFASTVSWIFIKCNLEMQGKY
jgi:hypothetical protein